MTDFKNTSTNMGPSRQQPRVRRRPNIDLGDIRSESFGEWLYSHRMGVIAVIVSIILGGIFIATARVNIEVRPLEYIVEFVDVGPTAEEVEKLRERRDKLQEEINRRLASIEKVKNVQSNESAEEGGSQSQSYDSETQQMMDKIASDMASNRNDYESGMKDVKGIGKGGSGTGSGGKKGEGKDSKFKGAVTISYDISYVNGTKKVARTARSSLYKPAYRAKGDGVVVVEVKINRNGTVTSVIILSSTNRELNSYALEAAQNAGTLFNIDPDAPTSNVGTITYTFVAQ